MTRGGIRTFWHQMRLGEMVTLLPVLRCEQGLSAELLKCEVGIMLKLSLLNNNKIRKMPHIIFFSFHHLLERN